MRGLSILNSNCTSSSVYGARVSLEVAGVSPICEQRKINSSTKYHQLIKLITYERSLQPQKHDLFASFLKKEYLMEVYLLCALEITSEEAHL